MNSGYKVKMRSKSLKNDKTFFKILVSYTVLQSQNIFDKFEEFICVVPENINHI